MKAKLKHYLYNVNSNTLMRIGDDLRKGGYLAGMGIVGIVMFSDDISLHEGIILYLSDKVKPQQQNRRNE